MVNGRVIDDGLVLRFDGARPLSAASVESVQALCDRAEDEQSAGAVTVRLSGVPADGWSQGVTVGLVSKWERAVRRFERLGRLTVASAAGSVGGTALDLLLAADVRIAAPGTRLLVPVAGDATWPGMTLYRLTELAGVAGIRRAALLGTPIEAERAVELNLVDELAGDVEAVLARIEREAAGLAGRELAIRRQLLFDAGSTSFEDALGAHLAAADRSLRHGAVS